MFSIIIFAMLLIVYTMKNTMWYHVVFRIRRASEADEETIAECSSVIWESLRGLLPEDWIKREVSGSRELARRIVGALRDPSMIALIAEVSGEVVGIAYGRYSAGSAHLGFI